MRMPRATRCTTQGTADRRRVRNGQADADDEWTQRWAGAEAGAGAGAGAGGAETMARSRAGTGTGTGLGMNAEWIGVQRKSRKREAAYSSSGFATLDELRSHYEELEVAGHS